MAIMSQFYVEKKLFRHPEMVQQQWEIFVHKMDELIKKISRMDNDVVFVGGVSEMKHGIKKNAKDIDIVVLSVKGLEFFGEIKHWITDSVFSKSKKRAFIKRNDFNIDIFIEDKLPEYELIDNIKCETIDSMILYYRDIEKETVGKWNEIIKNKIKNLEDGK